MSFSFFDLIVETFFYEKYLNQRRLPVNINTTVDERIKINNIWSFNLHCLLVNERLDLLLFSLIYFGMSHGSGGPSFSSWNVLRLSRRV